MSVNRLGIFGLQLMTGGNVSTPIGANGLAWLFSDAPGSVPRYFHECSSGMITITAEVRDGLRIEPGDAAGIVTHLNAGTDESKRTAIQSLLDHTRTFEGVGDLRRFDALIFVCTMRQVTGPGFQSLVSYEGEQIPAVAVSDQTSHSTFCHEVGHAIGLDHSFQSGWTNPDPERHPYGEYGDPSDIMSARTWGGTPAAFALPHDPASDIAADADLWKLAGPSISPTTLWRYKTRYMPPPPWVRVIPADGPPAEVNLRRPGTFGVDSATAVAAMPDSSGTGWWTVEYRPAQAWDRGFNYNPPVLKNAPGLIIHRVHDLGPFPDERNRLHVVDFIDTLAVPGGDDDFDNGQFAVRVLGGGNDSARVLVGRTLPSGRSTRLRLDRMMTGVPEISAAGQEEVGLTGEDCGTHVYTMQRYRTNVRVTAEARTTGYASPAFTFRVNGMGTAGVLTVGSGMHSGQVTFRAQVQVPVSRFESTLQLTDITADWQIAGYRLWLDLPMGHGRYEVRIEVRAEELGAGLAYDTSDSIEVVTMSIELPPDAANDFERCLRKLTAEEAQLHLPPRQWPEPVGSGEEPDWSSLKGRRLLQAVNQLSVLESTHPRLARDRRAQIAAGTGMHPGELDVLAARLGGHL